MFSRNSEEDHGRNISVKFHQNRSVVSEKKMFKEKVNARTDGRTHGRTDNRPRHKLAGLRPVELKMNLITNDFTLENVSKQRVLGVLIDNKLTWHYQIDYV